MKNLDQKFFLYGLIEKVLLLPIFLFNLFSKTKPLPKFFKESALFQEYRYLSSLSFSSSILIVSSVDEICLTFVLNASNLKSFSFKVTFTIIPVKPNPPKVKSNISLFSFSEILIHPFLE